MSYFDQHVFFCTNQRDNNVSCCNDYQAGDLRLYMKDKVKQLKLSRPDRRIRINSAGCLGLCDLGPVIVVYPENIWYTYIDQHDLDEIIESHLIHGNPVERLRIDQPDTKTEN